MKMIPFHLAFFFEDESGAGFASPPPFLFRAKSICGGQV